MQNCTGGGKGRGVGSISLFPRIHHNRVYSERLIDRQKGYVLWRNQLGCRAQENEEAGVNDVGLCTCLPVDRPCQLWQLTGSQTINNQSLPLWIMLFSTPL